MEGEDSKAPLVYVKKWMKTRHAIMFRLSNKIVQVNFTDKTEIILSSENKMVHLYFFIINILNNIFWKKINKNKILKVTYVNKKGERSNYPLATALDSSNTEMAKRYIYIIRKIILILYNYSKDWNILKKFWPICWMELIWIKLIPKIYQ